MIIRLDHYRKSNSIDVRVNRPTPNTSSIIALLPHIKAGRIEVGEGDRGGWLKARMICRRVLIDENSDALQIKHGLMATRNQVTGAGAAL